MDAVPSLTLRGTTFRWGSRTYLMGIVNVTPDSFSGDGLLGTDEGAARVVEGAVEQGRRMVEEGANILDVGGESSRPGHQPVAMAEELRRVVPVVRALRAALPQMPISIDTMKREVAEAALDAGADMINDVWGVGAEADLARCAAERGVPYVLMHNREEPRYHDLMAEIVAELQAAVRRAVALGVDPNLDLVAVHTGGRGADETERVHQAGCELFGGHSHLVHVDDNPIAIGAGVIVVFVAHGVSLRVRIRFRW